ncbi:hypothetical protein Ae168Ps1_6036 [Pseudonocardia sp. Ae168_Ps1]|nr:hypothetical protein Ae150APs1_5981 [Pseudonocardia sp. Ae150A_Ps1]OLL70571.1 hypothetical protein Ae168Ps1_6036 [Pseudonocardia sp. Ae168_Ps1]OLL89356.1 hypothetical protein Ae356Ps1_6100 [Pseudonocardia sp. Ae356_Ps1]OLL89821.1 hypothetical protein Ae331Ps2_6157c [Pseudonocardia sp. Ae331_Ps2]OLM09763.1 hypothetical protein Ae706Ps2_6225c [Pseudonocardia sp. Ae706_Ps2]
MAARCAVVGMWALGSGMVEASAAAALAVGGVWVPEAGGIGDAVVGGPVGGAVAAEEDLDRAESQVLWWLVAGRAPVDAVGVVPAQRRRAGLVGGGDGDGQGVVPVSVVACWGRTAWWWVKPCSLRRWASSPVVYAVWTADSLSSLSSSALFLLVDDLLRRFMGLPFPGARLWSVARNVVVSTRCWMTRPSATRAPCWSWAVTVKTNRVVVSLAQRAVTWSRSPGTEGARWVISTFAPIGVWPGLARWCRRKSMQGASRRPTRYPVANTRSPARNAPRVGCRSGTS